MLVIIITFVSSAEILFVQILCIFEILIINLLIELN